MKRLTGVCVVAVLASCGVASAGRPPRPLVVPWHGVGMHRTASPALSGPRAARGGEPDRDRRRRFVFGGYPAVFQPIVQPSPPVPPAADPDEDLVAALVSAPLPPLVVQAPSPIETGQAAFARYPGPRIIEVHPGWHPRMSRRLPVVVYSGVPVD